MSRRKLTKKEPERRYEDTYLLQQLQMHQAELEMQNDELRLANEQLELQHLKFAGIYDLAPIGYFILDNAGLVLEVNNAGINILGVDKGIILKRSFQIFMLPEYSELYQRFFREMLRTETKQSCMLKLTDTKQREYYVQLEGIAIRPASVLPLQCDIAMIDITERVIAEKILFKTKERLEFALEASASGTWELELETMKFYLDEFNYQTFLISGREFDGRYQTFINLLHPDDRTMVDQQFRAAINKEQEIDVNCRFINSSGHDSYASIRGHMIRETGHPDYYIGIMMDITEKRRIEDESAQLKNNQQKNIALATLAAEENERKRISDSLHDSVSQLLYGIRIRLASLETEDNRPEVKNVNELLDAAIEETRNLSFELAPAILTDFGLYATLEALATRLSTDKMSIDIRVTGINERLELPLEISIFRIVQELVNNAMKHSEATRITVSVQKNRLIEIKVIDNGKGFPARNAAEIPTGTGLTRIRSRINLYSGRLIIDSIMGKGTTVTATLNDMKTNGGTER